MFLRAQSPGFVDLDLCWFGAIPSFPRTSLNGLGSKVLLEIKGGRFSRRSWTRTSLNGLGSTFFCRNQGRRSRVRALPSWFSELESKLYLKGYSTPGVSAGPSGVLQRCVSWVWGLGSPPVLESKVYLKEGIKRGTLGYRSDSTAEVGPTTPLSGLTVVIQKRSEANVLISAVCFCMLKDIFLPISFFVFSGRSAGKVRPTTFLNSLGSRRSRVVAFGAGPGAGADNACSVLDRFCVRSRTKTSLNRFGSKCPARCRQGRGQGAHG